MLRLTYTMGTVFSFRKKNDQYPYYINAGSSPPKKVFKQIPNSVIRLSTNSPNEDIFTQNKTDYEIAFKKIMDIKKNSYIKVEKTLQTCTTV